jgi:hypothetical protein
LEDLREREEKGLRILVVINGGGIDYSRRCYMLVIFKD